MAQMDRKPGVLLVTDNLKVGGVQTVVVRLARALIDRGHTVGVAASREGELWDAVPDSCVRYYIPGASSPSARVRAFKIIRRAIKSGRYEVVHSHQRRVSLLAKMATIGTRVGLVEHVHNVFLPVTQRLLSFRGDILVACGSRIATMLTEEYGRPAGKVLTILNGTPDPVVEGLPDATLRTVDTDTVRIIGVGRLCAQKNPEAFIDVVWNLQQLGVKVEAEWVGGGELLDRCRNIVSERSIPNIHFTGPSNDVCSKLARADVLLMTSRWEGLPLVLLESMSLGLATVAPDVGSCRDAVVTGENGILYGAGTSPRDVSKQLAAAFKTSEWRDWGRASRRRYEESFSLDAMADSLSSLYSDLNEKKSLRA